MAKMLRPLLLVASVAAAAAFAPGPAQLRPRFVQPAARACAVPPVELPPSGTKLDEFLVLIGRCYAGASVAHAVDFATANALPAAAGVVPFAQMTPAGETLGVIWCLVGFAQLLGQDRDSRKALAIAYGAYEIVLTLATGAVTSDPANLPLRLGAAVGLQAVVYYCYVQLRQQLIDAAAEAAEAARQKPATSRFGWRRAAAPKMMAPRPRAGQSKTAPAGGRRSAVGRRGSPEEEAPTSVQEKLEAAFGKDLFRSLVVLTGVLCYPLMLYGMVNRPH